MEAAYSEAIAEMGISLASIALKGTASIVDKKIKALKSEKDIEKIKAAYGEIINELITEREDTNRIAQAYKSELERIVISDEDIAHLQKTVESLLEIIRDYNPGFPLDTCEQIRRLISIDTLKTMQLLGFNFKKAIGEPLTIICEEAILSLSKNKRSQNTMSKKK